MTLALRPEKMSLTAASTGDEATPGKITGADYLGTSTSFKVLLDGNITLSVREQNPVDAQNVFANGDAVSVTIPSGTARMLVD